MKLSAKLPLVTVVLAAALFTLKRIPGIARPAIGALLPGLDDRRTFLLDPGDLFGLCMRRVQFREFLPDGFNALIGDLAWGLVLFLSFYGVRKAAPRLGLAIQGA